MDITKCSSALVHLKAPARIQCHVTNAAPTVKRSLSHKLNLSISKGYEGICVTGSGPDWVSRKTQGQEGILQHNSCKGKKEAFAWPTLNTFMLNRLCRMAFTAWMRLEMTPSLWGKTLMAHSLRRTWGLKRLRDQYRDLNLNARPFISRTWFLNYVL